jgi:hypothetical protein
MKPANSSTSASDPTGYGARRMGIVLLWAVLWIAAADLVLGRMFPLPTDSFEQPRGIQRFFSHGRSVEGKVRAMVQPDDARSAWIVPEGWLATLPRKPQPTAPSGPSQVLVASYGQSFTKRLLEAAAAVDKRIELRQLDAPSAPLGHSYAAYQRDRGRHQAQVVVIGVLSSALPLLTTMTPMTWGFESPYPYTYPRYTLNDGLLREWTPSIASLADFRGALADSSKWAAFRNELWAHDAAYRPWVFDQNILDRSVTGRLFRRAIGQRHQNEFLAGFHSGESFNNELGILDVAEALLTRFAETARADGRVPYVFLFDNRDQGDRLSRALGPRLRARSIPFLSSAEIAPAKQPASFSADGHFRPDLDRRLAQRWLSDLYPLLGRK